MAWFWLGAFGSAMICLHVAGPEESAKGCAEQQGQSAQRGMPERGRYRTIECAGLAGALDATAGALAHSHQHATCFIENDTVAKFIHDAQNS